MTAFLTVLMVLAMAAVAVSLGMGLWTMMRGHGEQAARRSNRLMQLRVLFQGLALVFLALILWLSGRS
ncbi:MAG: twin transmembrane helix small protein [Pseudomonadota bacterium]|nr:twin transmembrane helix small protein [Pseudomonadota bacterium]